MVLLVFAAIADLIKSHGLTSEHTSNADAIVGKHNTGRERLGRSKRAHENKHHYNGELKPWISAVRDPFPYTDAAEQRKCEKDRIENFRRIHSSINASQYRGPSC